MGKAKELVVNGFWSMWRIFVFYLKSSVHIIKNREVRIAVMVPHGFYDIDDQGKVASAGEKTDTGGQTIYCWELFGWMSQLPFVKVDMYHRGFDDYPDIFISPRFPNLRLIRIKCGPAGFVRKENLYGEILDEFVNNCFEFIKKHKLRYKVIHGHYADGGYVGFNLKERLWKELSLKVKFFFTFHSLGEAKKRRMTKAGDSPEEIASMNFDIRREVELACLKAADCIAATTFDEPEDVKHLYGVRPKWYQIILGGFDHETFIANSWMKGEKPSWLPDKYVVMAPGRMENSKGHHLLLEAFIDVLKHYPDLKLIIISGKKDPVLLKTEREKAQHKLVYKIIQENNLGKNVIHLNSMPQRELFPIIRFASMYVSPAGFEPLGLTIIEAMIMAIICIISEKAGAVGLCTDGVDSLIVNPFDKITLAGAILWVLEHQEEAIAMGQAGVKTASPLSWKNLSFRLLWMYFGINASFEQNGD